MDTTKIEEALKKEVKERELGDQKTMELAAKTEDFCAKLGQKILEKLGEKDTKKVEQLIVKQKKDFDSFKTNLKKNMENAIEEMMGVIERELKKGLETGHDVGGKNYPKSCRKMEE